MTNPTQLSEALAPCPFCGDEALPDPQVSDELHFMVCAACCAEGPIGGDRIDAIERWNARSARPQERPADESERQKALESFTEWFRQNYPGPDTVICKPDWHAPKIFRAVEYALKNATQPGEKS